MIFYSDPAVAPTKPIQHLSANDAAAFQIQPHGTFDTTYRQQFINRPRNLVWNISHI